MHQPGVDEALGALDPSAIDGDGVCRVDPEGIGEVANAVVGAGQADRDPHAARSEHVQRGHRRRARRSIAAAATVLDLPGERRVR
jgi:hypothetical protein